MKTITIVEVYREDMPDRPIATIEPYYPYRDDKHPRRLFCFSIGFHCYYSETAKSLEDMVGEYILDQVQFDYCIKEGINLRFVPKHVEVDE